MRMLFENHSFATTRCMELVDVTTDLEDLVDRSEVQNGMAVVFSPHTTCAVLINEHEEGFIRDFEDLVRSLVPDTRDYRHDDMTLRTENLEDDSHDVPNGHVVLGRRGRLRSLAR
jgi:secondary thiamine-phosphate synthase enzyme